MHLEARSPSCFSTQYLLKLDGRPVGQFRGRWFSEGIDIRLTERLQLHFEKSSWLRSDFRLVDASNQEVLANGRRAGLLSRTWDLDLRTGPGQLVPVGLFSSGYEVRQDGDTVAHAMRIDWCSRGWEVTVTESGSRTIDATDLVFVGLVYHTILQRQRSNNNSS